MTPTNANGKICDLEIPAAVVGRFRDPAGNLMGIDEEKALANRP